MVEPIAAFAVSLEHVQNVEDMLIAYGDKRILVFERLTPNFEEKLQVLIRTEPRKLYAVRNANAKTNDVALKTLTPEVIEEDVDYKSALILPKKKKKASELPMEMRLENLNIVGDGASGELSTAPKAQSKVQLLIQALHSQDKMWVFFFVN